MAGNETKKCPRCSSSFECRPGNITQCQCYGVVFSEQEKEYIRYNYTDCLCRNCLEAMANEHDSTVQKVD